MKKNGILTGTLILTVAGFFCKFIGAISKIPLTNILTSEGVGIYQLTFPLYSLLLIISSSGIPVAISKIISERNNDNYSRKVVKYALKLMLIISSLLTVIIILLSGFISNIQGNPQAYLSYIIISPSIIFVSIISVFRGYFQGNQNFTPTAISQIVEQVIKISLSLLLAFILTKIDIIYGVMGAVFSITLSEFVALLFLYTRYKKNFLKNIQITEEIDVNKKEIRNILLKTAFPITITAVTMPILSLLDSIIFMQGFTKIGYSNSLVTSMYGVESGIVTSLLNLPIVFSSAISSSIIPLISGNIDCKKNVIFAYKSILFVMLPIVTFYIIYSKQILSFLFSNALLSGGFNLMQYATNMLCITSITMFYASISSLSTSILQAKNKLWTPFIVYVVFGFVKIILNFALLKIRAVNIYCISISSVILYFGSAVVLLTAVKRKFNFTLNYQKNILYPLCILTIFATFLSVLAKNITSNFVSLVIGGVVLVLGVWFVLLTLNFYSKQELPNFMFKNKSIV